MSSKRRYEHLICFVLLSIVSLSAVAEATSSSNFQPRSYSKSYSSARAGGQSSSRARSSNNDPRSAATHDYASHLSEFLTIMKRQPIWSSLGGLITTANEALFRQERNDASSDHSGLNNSDSSFPAMARIASLLLYSFLSAELLNGIGFFQDEHWPNTAERNPSEFLPSGIVNHFQSLQLSFSQWFQTNTAPGGALRFSTWKDKLNDTLFAENYLTYRWNTLSPKHRFAIGCALGAISIRSLTVLLDTVRSVGVPLYLLSEVVRNLRRMPAPEWTADWSGLDGSVRECVEEWDAVVRDGLRQVEGVFRMVRRSVRSGIRFVDDQLEKVRVFVMDPGFGDWLGDWVEEEAVLVVGLLAGSVFGFFSA